MIASCVESSAVEVEPVGHRLAVKDWTLAGGIIWVNIALELYLGAAGAVVVGL